MIRSRASGGAVTMRRIGRIPGFSFRTLRRDLQQVAGLFKCVENFFCADYPLLAVGAGGKAEEPVIIEID